ncbi:uncharacterized protein TM35_000641120 [Trypanosoma theileri]|uniref:Titin n=1 Tax=Trypanosoma theileri TaxID=67003 RepID=A0A1X0NHN3_9TRYP|nr:uncharacterized protein TM35_000641120 [Trypanosoma theileri]ORC83580.1 hypothetical protein TM35_000641120 [Trypanosoma theileri]
MMCRVLCFLALLLSVVSLCVTAEATPSLAVDSGGPCPAGTEPSAEKSCKPASPAVAISQPPGPPPPPPSSDGGDGDACTTASTSSECPRITSEREGALTDCKDSSETEGCITSGPKTKKSCPDGSDQPCPQPQQETDRTINNTRENQETIQTAPTGVSGEQGEAAAGKAVSGGGASSSSEPPSPVPTPTPPAPTPISTPASTPTPTEESVGESSVDGQPGSKDNHTPREGENGDNNGPAATQPSAASPNTSPTGSGDGSDTATAESGTTPAGSESSSNQQSVGNADSSSSISSSLWMRVPLLIVVTLACILVC